MFHYFNPATEKHFPDMMHGWNAYCNDNKRNGDMIEPDAMNALLKAIQANQKTGEKIIDVLKMHHNILEDHDNRIKNLEEILGE